MRTLRFLLISFSFTVLCPTLTAKEKKSPSFPFPVEVDKAKGMTASFPNRVKDKHTGIWYLYVPGDKYRIGTNDRPDSKAIEVTLSAFYIAESKVTYAQVAQYLEERLKEELTKGEAAIPKDLDPDEERYLRLTTDAYVYRKIAGPWLAEKQLSSRFLEKEEIDTVGEMKSFHEVLKLLKKNPKALKQLEMELPDALAQEEAQLKEVKAIYRKQLRVLQVRDGPCGSENLSGIRGVNHKQAENVATWAGVSLPTEAQWEVAARLQGAGRLDVKGLSDYALDWCSDFYGHNYFHRSKDFVDPKGPARGKLSGEQLANKGGSSLGIISRMQARRYHVLRGRTVDTRWHGYYGDLASTQLSIRLAFAAKERK